MSNRNRRSEGGGRGVTASISRGPDSSPADGKDHLHLNVKVSSNKLRQAISGNRSSTTSADRDPGGEILAGKRNRGGKKNYVIESDSDSVVRAVGEDVDAEGDDDDEAMPDLSQKDADGEVDKEMMDVDAEGNEVLGDEDGDGEEDTNVLHGRPTRAAPKPALFGKQSSAQPKSSDDELSELDSDEDIEDMDETVLVDAEGEDEDAPGEEEDAEGEEDEITQIPMVSARGEEEEDDDDFDSDDEMSRAETPDLTKMTKRQRARFVEEPQQYMKLSDEVQVKKHLTAEEQSMRRAEMARRRRNLSEKRTEEVKMETINKLLKKQAPKTNRKAGQGDQEGDEITGPRPNARFVRWVSTKEGGNRVGVPEEILGGPVGGVFVGGVKATGGRLPNKRLIEEVS